MFASSSDGKDEENKAQFQLRMQSNEKSNSLKCHTRNYHLNLKKMEGKWRKEEMYIYQNKKEAGW